MRYELHLSGKCAAAFVGEESAAADSDMGSIRNISWLQTRSAADFIRGVSNRTRGTSTHKPVTKCIENISEADYKCVCLNARSTANNKNVLSTTVE